MSLLDVSESEESAEAGAVVWGGAAMVSGGGASDKVDGLGGVSVETLLTCTGEGAGSEDG